VTLNFLPVIRILRRAGAVIANGQDAFCATCDDEPNSSHDAVRVFLALGGDLEAPVGGAMPEPTQQEASSARVGDKKKAMANHDSMTAWLHAAARGDVPLLQALRDAGADTNACQQTYFGSHTAVGVAAMGERVEALQQLLAWKVPLCGANTDAARPLAACLEEYDRELFLIARWADKSGNEDYRPDTAPKIALAECCVLLLEQGERPDPKEIIAACQNLRLLEVLWPHAPRLDADSAAQALDSVCSAAFNAQSVETRAPFARAFLEQGASLKRIGERYLRKALEHGDAELVALLKASGATESNEPS